MRRLLQLLFSAAIAASACAQIIPPNAVLGGSVYAPVGNSTAVVLPGSLEVTTTLTVDSTTDSGATNQGALIVKGGAGFAKNVYVGGAMVAGSTPFAVGASTANGSVNVAADYGVVIRGKAGTNADVTLTQGTGTLIGYNTTGTSNWVWVGNMTIQAAGTVFQGTAATNTSSSVVFGTDIAPSTGSGRTKVTLGTSANNTELIMGQDATHNLVTFWSYNATAGSAYAAIQTYGTTNELRVDASTLKLQTSSGGATQVGGVLQLKSYTVSGLPSASTSGAGAIVWVTDLTSITSGSTDTGGGSLKHIVASDGTNWVVQ